MTDPRFARAFACVLNTARRKRGLSQQDLASASGFDRTYPSLLERGLRELKVTSFLRLCDALSACPITMLQDTLQMMRLTAPPPLPHIRRGRPVGARSQPSRSRPKKSEKPGVPPL